MQSQLKHPRHARTAENLFFPELVVEACHLCNLRCQGCYAPNLFRKRHDARFLSTWKLQEILKPLPQIEQVSIRGGEPSLHPEIINLFHVVRNCSRIVYFETHGRWIQYNQNPDLLETLVDFGAIVKISFDSMHKISNLDLEEICTRISRLGGSYAIAITEQDENEAKTRRKECAWAPDHVIIFHKKATHAHQLFQPRHGVVTPYGEIRKSLSTIF